MTNVVDAKPERVWSIDALRGFDMFWIVGGDILVRRWLVALKVPQHERLTEQLEHVDWEGFRFYDLIFPLFLFLVGVVLPFSLGKLREAGASPGAVYGRILRRTFFLILLGLIANGLLRWEWPFRITGVLQRIGIGYGVAAILTYHFGPALRAGCTLAILVGYWALFAFVPSPESKLTGDFSKEGSLAGWVDRNYLPGKIMKEYYGLGDNEGLVSMVPAIATALLGTLAGNLLLAPIRKLWKTLLLFASAGVLLTVAWFWAWGDLPPPYRFPVIKILWTSSFVLWAGGWSFLLLGVFYGIIDGLGFRAWAFPWVVIGANAITIYMLPRFVDFQKMSQFFLGGFARLTGDPYGPALLATGVVALQWALLYHLYRHRIFLRV